MLVAQGGEHLRHGLPFGGEGAAVVGLHVDNLSYVVLCCQRGMVRLSAKRWLAIRTAQVARTVLGQLRKFNLSRFPAVKLLMKVTQGA